MPEAAQRNQWLALPRRHGRDLTVVKKSSVLILSQCHHRNIVFVFSVKLPLKTSFFKTRISSNRRHKDSFSRPASPIVQNTSMSNIIAGFALGLEQSSAKLTAHINPLSFGATNL